MTRIDEDRDDGKPLSEAAEYSQRIRGMQEDARLFLSVLEDFMLHLEPAASLELPQSYSKVPVSVCEELGGALTGKVVVRVRVREGYHSDADACNRLLYGACKKYVEAFRDEFEPPLRSDSAAAKDLQASPDTARVGYHLLDGGDVVTEVDGGESFRVVGFADTFLASLPILKSLVDGHERIAGLGSTWRMVSRAACESSDGNCS